MNFDVDVSGEDLLSKNYTICIANNENIIRGYKFNETVIKKISFSFSNGEYRYKRSKKGTVNLKIRTYCIILYYLIDSLKLKRLNLTLCRDFYGKEKDIESNLEHFLGKLLCIEFNLRFSKLDKDSNAHKYAYLMRKDTKNQLKTYVNINFSEIENFLKK